MALADLIARLEQDADAQVRAIAQEADEQVRAIEATGRQECERRAAQTLDERRAERQATLRRGLAEARRAARARELEAGEALVGRILARTRSLFAEAAGTDAYRESLTGLSADTLSYLEAVPCRIRCRAVDVALVSAAASSRSDVTVEASDDIGPGLVADAIDLSVTIDQTLDARLTRLAGALAIELLAEVRDGGG